MLAQKNNCTLNSIEIIGKKLFETIETKHC